MKFSSDRGGYGIVPLPNSQRLGKRRITKLLLVMKLTMILLTVTCLHAAARTQGQVTYSGKEVPLVKVFAAIEAQTDYKFVFNPGVLSGTAPVTVEFKNVTLEDAVRRALKSQPLEFKIINKTVFISQKPDVKTAAVQGELLKRIDVKGKLLNNQNGPVAGATITVKGESVATVSDENGLFVLTGVEENATLIITNINYETREYKLNGKTDVLIELDIRTKTLSEVNVVINSGYQKVSKARYVGSATTVDSTLFNRRVSTDIISRLDGVTNGVLFDKRNDSRLQIRGVSTLSGNNTNPLIILDNFPFNGTLSNINPNDVEEIHVLKDAAAASIWGAKAGNGVIVITSKKGKYNQSTRLDFSSNVTISQKPDLDYFEQISTSDFIDLEKFLFDKGLYNNDLNNVSTRPVISPVVEILNKEKKGLISSAEAASQINKYRNINVRDEIESTVYRPGVNVQNYLSIAGGSSMANYQVSLGYDKNTPNVIGPGNYKRYTINSSTSFRPLNFVELHFDLNISQAETRTNAFSYLLNPGGGKSQIYPYARLEEDGQHLALPRDRRLAYVDTVGQGKLLDWHYRPLDEINLENNRLRTQYVLFNFGTTLKFTKWLTGDIKYQFAQQNITGRNLQSVQSYFTRNLINSYTQKNTYKQIIPVGDILDKSQNELASHSFRGQLTFAKSINSIHQINAIVATEISDNKNASSVVRFYGYDDEVSTYSTAIDYATSHPLFTGGSGRIPNPSFTGDGLNRNRTASFLGNLSYTYFDRYTLYASARRDGSNIFGVKTNNKWKPLWSVGASWDITKESFFQTEFISNLKLRSSYGYTGNSNNTIPAVTTFGYIDVNPYTNLPYAQLNQLPNPDLRWEEVGIVNLGLDFSVLKNRISGSFDWFIKKSKDVIAPFPIDPTSGNMNANFINKNAANLRTRGFDLSLMSSNLTGKFSWNTIVNFSYAKTIITKYYQNQQLGIPPQPPTISINPIEGQVAWGLYSYKWGGLDPATGNPRGFLNKGLSTDYIKIMNDSLSNHVFHGSTVPLYFGNLMNNFSFKGFALSFNITYRFDYYYMKNALNYSTLYSWALAGSSEYVERWKQPGDEMKTNVPSISYPANLNRDKFYAQSEINVRRGDNIRLNDARLSYSWNAGKKRLPIKGAQIYFYLNNLNWMIWKASDLKSDPDFGMNAMPPTKSGSIGCNLNF